MTLKKPSISIAMVTYNHEKYVAEAIQSILNQTFTDFELIIVNDGSTDKTEDIIKSFDDSRITYIYQKNQGPSTATNTAILASEGKYLALMSGDDSCNPERLEKQYQFLSSSPEHKIVFSHVDFINENSRPMASEWGENTFNHPNFKSRAELLRHFFFLGNCLNAVTCMLERKIVLEAGLFNVASIQLQDYDMWLKLVKKYDFHVLPAKLIKYRIRDADSNLSSTTHSVRSCFEHYVIAKNLFDDVSISLFKTAFSDHLIHKNFTTEIEYELEKAFLYLKNEIPLLSMIGTQKLFYLLQDKETLNISRNQYKFDLPDLYKLMAIADISKSVKLNEIKQLLDQSRVQLNEIKQLLDQSRAQLDAVLHSTSWSITKPLRFFNIHLNVNSMQKIIVTLKNAVFFPFRLIKYYGGPIPLFKKMMQVIARERLSIFRRIFKHSKKLIQHINNSSSCYDSWYKSQLTNRCLVAQNDSIQLLRANQKPKISIVIPVCDPSLEHLKKALDSVLHQYYQNWELCIADDCSSNEAVKNTLREYAARDSRIKTAFRSERGHISEALNSGLELATGDYIGFLDHDDELERDALYWVAKTIIENPTAKFIYSDEDKISPQGTLERPYFKPDWNKDLLLSQNYICHLLVLEKNLLSRLGGFNSLYNGSQDYDLVLRASELCDESEIKHIPLVLYHWREHAGSTAMNIGAKPYAVTAGLRAVTDHLKRLGIAATVAPAPAAPFWNRIQYSLPEKLPLVSIIIPTRNRCDLLKVCIDSLQSSSYKNFEVIVIDNGSDNPSDLSYLEQIAQENLAKVVRIDIPFNYSRLNNMALKHASGDVLLFLNNDIEIIDPAWLTEIVSNIMRKEIGIVGARLWYPDFTLQHGGVLIGQGGIAGHAHHGLTRKDAGYFGRAILQQNLSAVTAACMALRREVFEQVGGFDESFVIAFNDVDLCLRVLQLGFKITWTPFAELIHHESASRGKVDETPEKKANTRREVALFAERWKDILLKDPAYNPNLTLDAADFSLAKHPRTDELMSPIR